MAGVYVYEGVPSERVMAYDERVVHLLSQLVHRMPQLFRRMPWHTMNE